VLFGDTIVQDYPVPKPELILVDGRTKIEIEGARQLGPAGGNALPFFPVRIILPPGHRAVSVEMEGMSPRLLGTDLLLAKSPHYRTISGAEGSKKLHHPATEDVAPPVTPVHTGFVNGMGIAYALFTPLFFTGNGHEAYCYEKVRIKVVSEPANVAYRALTNYREGAVRSLSATGCFDNPSATARYKGNGTRTTSYDYLIITPEQYIPEFDTLISVYKSRGYLAKAFSVEHIDSSMTGVDKPERIREFIKGEYQSYGIGFVLIGGDTAEVPCRKFYCQVQSSSLYTTNDMPSDLYYGALDGTWNDDNDNRWGEVGEEDLLPELAVGRFPFSDTAQLRNMLQKTIMYQQSPVIADLEKPLMLGEHLWSSPLTWGADYMDLLIGEHDDNGYSTKCIPVDHNIDSLYERAGSWNNSMLMARVNAGISAIHHCGHANYSAVMKLGMSSVTNANFYNANGVDHHFPVIFTHGCNCGGFDRNDCIGEKMLYIDNFASAFIGNSRYGWFVEGTTEGPAEHLHREFLDAVYSDSLYWIGTALKQSRIMTAPFVDLPDEYEPGAFRWNFYDINVLGDPGMAMWTYQPMDFQSEYRQIVPVGFDSLVVNLERSGIPLKYFRCSVFEGDSLMGSASSDTTGRAVIYLTGDPGLGTVELRVTGYNILNQSLELHIGDLWIGNSKDWSEPSNWASNTVPGQNRYVVIPSSPQGGFFPIENSSGTRTCKGLGIESAATIILNDGEILNVTGN
jgi:hypothetical protein